MEIGAYKEMAKTEVNHWFWIGRRSIIKRNIKNLSNSEMKILEVGSGTGGNFAMLHDFGKLTAVEMEPIAREIANERFPHQKVLDGALPNNIKVPLDYFDLICMFDVLEHIEESEDALKTVYKHLKTNGHIIITVPAYNWMWSEWDDLHHHKRRYTRKLLLKELQKAGFTVNKLSHFNTILFPLIFIARSLIKILGLKGDSGHGIPPNPINSMLAFLLQIEGFTLDYLSLPFGVSILAVAKK